MLSSLLWYSLLSILWGAYHAEIDYEATSAIDSESFLRSIDREMDTDSDRQIDRDIDSGIDSEIEKRSK